MASRAATIPIFRSIRTFPPFRVAAPLLRQEAAFYGEAGPAGKEMHAASTEIGLPGQATAWPGLLVGFAIGRREQDTVFRGVVLPGAQLHEALDVEAGMTEVWSSPGAAANRSYGCPRSTSPRGSGRDPGVPPSAAEEPFRQLVRSREGLPELLSSTWQRYDSPGRSITA